MSNYEDTCFALGIGIMSGTPTLLIGPPGQGKTSVIEQIFRHYGLHLETVIASIREPSDFAGLPVVDAATGTVRLAPPNWARRLADAEKGGVFYDELTTAAPATQAALLRPILDNHVGDLYLGDDIRTVAAANPADMAAGGHDLPAPMSNRFLHLNWELPAEVVREGFSLGWPEIPLPVAEQADIDRLIKEAKLVTGAFLGVRQHIVTKVPDSSEAAGRPYPTPRSWEQAATLYGYAMAVGANSNVVQMLISGSVGDVATGEFITFITNLDLPDPQELLRNPSKFVVPTDRGDKCYAIAASVLTAVIENNTPERWINCGEIYAAIAKAGFADISAAYGKRWVEARPAGAVPLRSTTDALIPILAELGRLGA